MIHLRSFSLRPLSAAQHEQFPFTVPVIRSLGEIALSTPITFFVGENGSGKSTVLEGIACAARLPVAGEAEGERDKNLANGRELAKQIKLVWTMKPRTGFFLRAEDFFGYAKRLNAMRAEMEAEVAAIDREYAHRSAKARGLAKMGFGRELGAMRQAYGEGLDAQSHGESFFKFFQARFAPGGLYLLDEPEAPLSPMRQLIFLSMLRMMVAKDAQFIIATHAPILLAYPGATIFSFRDGRMEPTDFDRLEHVNVTRSFLDNPQAYLKPLFDDVDAAG